MYESQVVQVSGAGVESAVTSFANQGFLTTTAVSNSAGYTLWGVRSSTASVGLESKVYQVSGSELDDSATTLSGQGYVIHAAVSNSTGYVIWPTRRL